MDIAIGVINVMPYANCQALEHQKHFFQFLIEYIGGGISPPTFSTTGGGYPPPALLLGGDIPPQQKNGHCYYYRGGYPPFRVW